ncbi:MAG: LptF/LptG family permease [Terrimicrobiaceae bacterium]
MRILDRYVLSKFFLPFIYCFVGFIAIWFIFDLSDNLPDFLQGRASLDFLLAYYRSQIPEIVVICLPIGTLLALLYSLTAMSRSNEIISMLGAGVSVSRILLPLFFVGLILTGVSAVFNYEAAPHAAMLKKQMIRDVKAKKKREPGLSAHLYRNREDNRTWFMRRIVPGNQQASDVQIVQQDAAGNITAQYYAKDAYFNVEDNFWVLYNGMYVEMNENQETQKEMFEGKRIEGWRETPWRIASSVMNPDYLSVPELKDYLQFNHDFPVHRLAPYRTQLAYRWALPWVCVLVVFLAAPMGIVYSRRGILGGVAVAIGLFFSLVLISSFFIALGKGNRISPLVAAWGPLIAFFGIGFFLLWLRSTNRDLPKLKIPGF